jgi:hypothetical protein
MSDCHSWFGSARSNRATFGCGLARALGLGVASPSCLSTRRTVVADVPSPK